LGGSTCALAILVQIRRRAESLLLPLPGVFQPPCLPIFHCYLLTPHFLPLTSSSQFFPEQLEESLFIFHNVIPLLLNQHWGSGYPYAPGPRVFAHAGPLPRTPCHDPCLAASLCCLRLKPSQTAARAAPITWFKVFSTLMTLKLSSLSFFLF
jgi:hypothetical protein